MHAKRTSIFFSGFSAMLACLVTFANFTRNLFPGCMVPWIGILARIFTNVGINIFASIPFNFAFARTKTAIMGFALFTTPCTSRKWLSARFTEASLRTIHGLIPVLMFKSFSALGTSVGRLCNLCLPITRTRAILCLFTPFFKRMTGLFSEYLAAILTRFFGCSHDAIIPRNRIAVMGNT